MAWRAETPCGAFGLGHCGWNGKLAAVTNANGFVTAYAYDVMDRLASDGGVAYTYDAAGNRMTKTENGETVIYTLGEGDRLASYGRAASPLAADGGSYTYDAAGNVTRMERDGGPTLDLVWNGQRQLLSVSTNGVFAEGYAYDALGRRAATTTREGTTRHVYDDGWQVVADIDGEGNVLASYVWGEGIDRLLAVRIGVESYYPLTDVQGTVWGYVDSSNAVVARWQYDVWGNVVDGEVSVPSLATIRYRFQGREWSASTGLVNFRMRWYDSVTGRWLSKDPIGLSGGMNLYAAWRNTPLLLWDPYGLVDMNLFSRDDAISNYADRHNPAGVFSVGAHGKAQDGVLYKKSDGKYYSIPVRSLARKIRRNPRCRHQPVQLDSCNVGNGQYPQQLGTGEEQ